MVENGSTDETTAVVERYPVRLLHNQVRPRPRNRGIQASEADFIAFTDADCLVAPTWLAELLKPFQDLTIGAVGGDIQPYRHNNRTDVELFNDENSPWVNYLSGKHRIFAQIYPPTPFTAALYWWLSMALMNSFSPEKMWK